MAAARDLKVSFVLRLRDLASSGLGALQRRLEGLAGLGRRIGLVGGALAGLSLMGPIGQAAAYEDTLRQSAITAGQSGAAATRMVAEMSRAYERLALQTGQRSQAIAEAAKDLVAAGLDPKQVDAFLPVIARTATATGASMQDLSRTAIALRQNLRITTAEELADTFGSLAQAGKAGMFELRDMAREFPQLTAAWQGIIDTANKAAEAQERASKLRMSGREAAASMAAMLQVARQGAASSGEAANNLANFLQKITAPETVRNFRELGVDIQKLMGDAVAKGINPVEAVLAKIREKTGGDMFKVGQLFGDRQVLDFLRPMLRGTDEYMNMLQGALAANRALINQDFATRMAGAYMQLEIVMEQVTQLSRRAGLAFASNLRLVDAALAGVQSGIAWLDAHFPGLVDATLAWAGTLIGLAGILGVAAPILGIVRAGFVLLLRPVLLLFTGLGRFLPLLRVLALALGILGVPVSVATAAVLALAAAAYLIWRNWSGIVEFFRSVWDRIWNSQQVTWLRETVVGAFKWAAGQVKAAWEDLKGFFSGLWPEIERRFDEFITWVDGWTGGAASRAIQAIKDAWDGLKSSFGDLWKGIEDRFQGFVDRVKEKLQPIINLYDRVKGIVEGRGAGTQPVPEPALGQADRRMAGRGAFAYGAEAAVVPGAGRTEPQRVEMTVRAAPGTQVEDVRATPGIGVILPERGLVVGRY